MTYYFKFAILSLLVGFMMAEGLKADPKTDAKADAKAESTSLITTKPTDTVWGNTGIPSVGYAFTVSAPIKLDKLGIYDMANGDPGTGSTGDGLVDAHFIGIWSYDEANDTATLSASVKIPAGGKGTADANGFIFAAPTFGAGVTLYPGTYILSMGQWKADGKTSTDDHFTFKNLTSTDTARGITILWASIAYNTETDESVPKAGKYKLTPDNECNAFIGPNMTFTVIKKDDSSAH